MNVTAGPLAGVSVLELGTMYAAPTCGRMLRDFGAQVVKVEDPSTGDYARHWTPQKNGLSLGFARLNAGKRSVGIDLRQPDGRDLVRRLAATVDVVVESFRPGRLESWGLGYEALAENNPGLILTRVSGFGQTGPYRERPGFGTVAETASGYAFINGWPDTPPTSPPFGFADSIAGISAALGTAMALYRRERTGAGDVIDVALYEPLMFIMGDVILKYATLGEIQVREGNGTGSASPRGIYQASDGGWLSIAASNEVIARRLFRAMGRPELSDDPRFATNQARMANNDAIQREVSGWVASLPRADGAEDPGRVRGGVVRGQRRQGHRRRPALRGAHAGRADRQHAARAGCHAGAGAAHGLRPRPGVRRSPVGRRAHDVGPVRSARPDPG